MRTENLRTPYGHCDNDSKEIREHNLPKFFAFNNVPYLLMKWKQFFTLDVGWIWQDDIKKRSVGKDEGIFRALFSKITSSIKLLMPFRYYSLCIPQLYYLLFYSWV